MTATAKGLAPWAVSLCLCLLVPLPTLAKTRITVFTHSYLQWYTQEKKIAAQFMKANPDIQVDVTPYKADGTTASQQYLSMAAAGIAPDLVLTNDIPAVELGERNLLTNLQAFSPDFGDLKDLSKSALETAKQYAGKGKLWWIPTSIGVTNRFSAINSAFALRAGLDPGSPPSTWNEMVLWAQKMTVKGADGTVSQYGTDGYTDNAFFWGIDHVLTAFRGEHHWYDPLARKAYFSDAKVTDIVGSWVALAKLGAAPGLASFPMKKVGIIIDCHGGGYRIWVKDAPSLVPVPIPGVTMRNALNYGYAMSKAIPATRRSAAWRFLKYRVSKEAFRVQWEGSRWDPASSAEANQDPEIRKIIHDDVLFEFGYRWLETVPLVPYDRRKVDSIAPVFQEQYYRALRGQSSVAQAMDVVQRKATELLNRK